MERERYRHLNKYLIEKFGERTLKICVDGHFSCPNRDGTLSKSGCIFCSECGSGELIKDSEKDITTQVKKYFESYKSKRANKFKSKIMRDPNDITDSCFCSHYLYSVMV